MKQKLRTTIALIAVCVLVYVAPAAAQGPNAPSKSTSKMLYHDGPILPGSRNLYFLFYGCWVDTCGLAGDWETTRVVGDFATSIGNSPYMQINSGDPGSNGQAPTGSFIYGGALVDNSYSHGVELTQEDVVGLISEKVNSFQLPQDPFGIYVIFASADVSATAMGFCTPGAPPFHDTGVVNGIPLVYVFMGNPNRCPSLAAAQFLGPGGTHLPTPNGSFAGDSIAANLAHALNGTVTNPWGNGWYDRYGSENADKCTGKFGTTYTTSNGARANVRMGGHDWLLEQNWVNDRKGRCAMDPVN
jgi:hypothetical protein